MQIVHYSVEVLKRCLLTKMLLVFNSRLVTVEGGAVAQRVERWTLRSVESRVQILLEATLRNNLGQVAYTYVPLSPSSITWYRPKGGDALRLGR